MYPKIRKSELLTMIILILKQFHLGVKVVSMRHPDQTTTSGAGFLLLDQAYMFEYLGGLW